MKRLKLFFKWLYAPCLMQREGLYYKMYKDRYGILSAWNISGELLKIINER